MTSSITAGLFTVTSPGSNQTHLCASSPALVGTRPDQVPLLTLCARTAGLVTFTLPVAEVGCPLCLINSSGYLGLPGWAAGPMSLPSAHPSLGGER
ncbi:MAG: hypothetical protein L6256_10160 [Propionicimonas sp.]|uniref:hypothetical protein n=1 Tax=Propionicimonas sp. TaxID=1955623 RepID=UPI0017B5EBAA|nr:hypothetical protein [Propionicimonas sp.]MBA3019681.1 hypothetical protein [Propionicimonas sp.]MBU4207974.1 hypothetical protein [Actinomycetota bacterium]MBU4411520.1 hypothetical protein [Actinomycetota bacterium]MCG2805799.1 hypothetical protein [Propionicimonas sp.]